MVLVLPLFEPVRAEEPVHINKQVSDRIQSIKGLEGKTPQPRQTLEPVAVVETPKEAPRVASSSGDIENIVRQAARKYGVDENYFVKIAKCESGLNPNSVNKNYFENGNPSGLFQHISGYWPARATKYGYPGASVLDPVANANVTAQMFRDGLQHLWECK